MDILAIEVHVSTRRMW